MSRVFFTITEELLGKIVDLSTASTESFSVTDRKQLPKMTKQAMDLLSMAMLIQSHMEQKQKPVNEQKLSSEINTPNIQVEEKEKAKQSLFHRRDRT